MLLLRHTCFLALDMLWACRRVGVGIVTPMSRDKNGTIHTVEMALIVMGIRYVGMRYIDCKPQTASAGMQEISGFSDNGLPNSLGLYKVFSIRACRYTTSAQVPKYRTPSLRLTEYTVIRQGVRSHFPPPLLVTCKTCHGPAQFRPHLKVFQPKAQSR